MLRQRSSGPSRSESRTLRIECSRFAADSGTSFGSDVDPEVWSRSTARSDGRSPRSGLRSVGERVTSTPGIASVASSPAITSNPTPRPSDAVRAASRVDASQSSHVDPVARSRRSSSGAGASGLSGTQVAQAMVAMQHSPMRGPADIRIAMRASVVTPAARSASTRMATRFPSSAKSRVRPSGPISAGADPRSPRTSPSQSSAPA